MGYRRKRHKYKLLYPSDGGNTSSPNPIGFQRSHSVKGHVSEAEIESLAIEIFGGTFWCMNDDKPISGRSE